MLMGVCVCVCTAAAASRSSSLCIIRIHIKHHRKSPLVHWCVCVYSPHRLFFPFERGTQRTRRNMQLAVFADHWDISQISGKTIAGFSGKNRPSWYGEKKGAQGWMPTAGVTMRMFPIVRSLQKPIYIYANMLVCSFACYIVGPLHMHRRRTRGQYREC